MRGALLTPEEVIDAHLWSIGIGSDARGKRVVVFGDGDEWVDRLVAFGATVVDYTSEIEASGASGGGQLHTADAVIWLAMDNDNGFYADVAIEDCLKPEGRYLIVVTPTASRDGDSGSDGRDSLVMTSVEQVGGDCVRITGYRPRRDGE